MKFSDIKGERTLDVIADIIEPIANIAEDEAAVALFKQEKLPEGETAIHFVVERLKKTLPSLLKGHKADIIAILATIKGVSAEEYANSLNPAKLFRDVTDLLNDDAFTELFSSAQSGEAETSSGSAPESTEAPAQ